MGVVDLLGIISFFLLSLVVRKLVVGYLKDTNAGEWYDTTTWIFLFVVIAAESRYLAPHTPILADFWIFSDQAQLLDPESAASKEPRSGLVA